MRHKYTTRAIVLARTPLGEANGLVTLLTYDLGLLRARAQGIRKPGAKLAAALATYAESTAVLVRGREGWRITGATLEASWFSDLAEPAARSRAARVAGLVLRLVAGETSETAVFPAFMRLLAALSALPPESHDAAECLSALSILAALGLDAGGDLPDLFDPGTPAAFAGSRSRYISRINRGIEASGL